MYNRTVCCIVLFAYMTHLLIYLTLVIVFYIVQAGSYFLKFKFQFIHGYFHVVQKRKIHKCQ